MSNFFVLDYSQLYYYYFSKKYTLSYWMSQIAHNYIFYAATHLFDIIKNRA